ncbi:Flp family type IVb pilin [Ruegeria atlantica]|uniref:Flp family type IVb pilin n=1 Tax=Ruegeria atlantica TaxID=81569 RepID=UPI00147C46A6|nr:Flp family type IVb pilin [Ruegeria atlantica]
MAKFVKMFVKEESGAAIVEYGLALLVVASIAITAFTFLGDETDENVTQACSAFGSANC